MTRQDYWYGGGTMNCTQRISALFLVVFALVPAARSQTVAQAKPVSPRDFLIMAWGPSPSDPEQLAGMKEAGLNASGFCRPEDLDRVKAAGLACFVDDPRVNDYNWEKLPRTPSLGSASPPRRSGSRTIRPHSGSSCAMSPTQLSCRDSAGWRL